MLLRATATTFLLSLLVAGPAAAVARDRDRDGMPDRWERTHRLSKARADHDRDGLRNRDEFRLKTMPRRRDTDRDGLRDGDEIRFGWHPRQRDTDRDGIRDGRENAGVVTAVDGQLITIKLARRGRLSGRLEDPQALTCAPALHAGTTAAGDDAGWLPEGAEQGDLSAPEEPLFWDPAWGEQPDDLDADEDDADSVALPLARAAQAEDLAGEEDASDAEDGEGEDFEGEDAEGEDAEGEDAAAEEAADCRAELTVGALVHEATSELVAGGRRLTRLRLVA